MRYTTYSEVGDLMSCPDTGYSGEVLAVTPHPEEEDIEFLIDGCGELFMRPTSEVIVYI